MEEEQGAIVSPEKPEAAPELDQVLAKAVRHVKAKRGGDLAAIIPNARFQRIDGAGHLVQEDAHDELSSLIIGFLDEPDPR